MRLSSIAITILLVTSLLSGQEKKESFEAAIIPVKTLTGDSFERLAKLLGVFNARFTADSKLRTIVVYAPKDVVDQMRRVIEQLDQPGSEAAVGRNIDMTLTLLRCSTTAQPEGPPMPADLESVAKQLRAVTQYKNIQLWDIVPLHIQEGKMTQDSFRLPGTFLSNANATALIRIYPEAVSRKESGRFVRFDQIAVDLKIPRATGGSNGANPLVNTQFIYEEAGLHTAGDFKEGQKTVLGKVSGVDDGTAIFVVVSLKVLD